MVVVQVMVAPEEETDLAVTVEITRGATTVLFIVTITEALPVFPALSVATAVSVCDPLAHPVVFQLAVYVGPVVSGDPRLMPSTWNCTLPMLGCPDAVAVAEALTVPDTFAPDTGAVTETVGGAGVGFGDTAAACPREPMDG